jgi:hypothetical protein
MSTKRKRNRTKVGGGMQRKKMWAHNIVKASRIMRGAGPTRNSGGPGPMRSLPTHVRIKSGPPSTFAT